MVDYTYASKQPDKVETEPDRDVGLSRRVRLPGTDAVADAALPSSRNNSALILQRAAAKARAWLP